MGEIAGLVTLFFIILTLKNIFEKEIKYGNIRATLKLAGFILLILVALFLLWLGYIMLISPK